MLHVDCVISQNEPLQDPDCTHLYTVTCVCVVQELDSSLDTLKAAFEKATSEKLRCQDEVNRTNTTILLANRLVKGLEV